MIMYNELESYKYFYETAPVGFYTTSVNDGEFIHANKMCMKILEVDSLEDLKKLKSKNFYLKNVRKNFIDLLKKGPVTDFEIEIKTPSGTAKSLLLTGNLKDGKYIEGCILDITEKVNLEKEVLNLINQNISFIKEVKQKADKRVKELKEEYCSLSLAIDVA